MLGARIFLNNCAGMSSPPIPAGWTSFSRTLRKEWVIGSAARSTIEGAVGVSERSQAVGAESHPSKDEGWGTRQLSVWRRAPRHTTKYFAPG